MYMNRQKKNSQREAQVLQEWPQADREDNKTRPYRQQHTKQSKITSTTNNQQNEVRPLNVLKRQTTCTSYHPLPCFLLDLLDDGVCRLEILVENSSVSLSPHCPYDQQHQGVQPFPSLPTDRTPSLHPPLFQVKLRRWREMLKIYPAHNIPPNDIDDRASNEKMLSIFWRQIAKLTSS